VGAVQEEKRRGEEERREGATFAMDGSCRRWAAEREICGKRQTGQFVKELWCGFRAAAWI